MEEAVGLQPRQLRISGAEIDVQETVVIQISHTCAHGSHRVVKLGRPGDVGERPVAIIAEQTVGIRMQNRGIITFLQTLNYGRERRQAGGQNVGPTVVVVIEKETDKAVVRRLHHARFLR